MARSRLENNGLAQLWLHQRLKMGYKRFGKLAHSKLRSIQHVATKVHVILQRFVVLTWMRDTIKLV
jgi:hypothetical protein